MSLVRRPARLAVLLLAAAAALCALLAAGIWLVAPTPTTSVAERALSEASSSWAARPIAHYELEIVREDGLANCSERIEVRDENVLGTSGVPCSDPPLTVTRLFAEVAELIERNEGTCGPNGCHCDGVVRLQASYDPDRGYPTRFRLGFDTSDRWLYVLRVWPRTGCTAMGMGFSTTKIRLTALP